MGKRRNIPIEQKIANGNPGKRPEDVDRTRYPQPAYVMPPMPEWLTEEAQKKWEQLGPILARNKLITEADGEAFGQFCEAWCRYVAAELQLRNEELTTFNASGSPIVNPTLKVIALEREACFKFMMNFGMTPAARVRVKGEPGTYGQPKSKWEEFMEGRVVAGGKK